MSYQIAIVVLALSLPIQSAELRAQQAVDLRTIRLTPWTPEVTVRIGGAGERDASFGYPIFLGTRTDGGIVIADASVPAIMIYNRDGKLRRLVGGRGQGPGEYQGLTGVGLYGDTVWVWDAKSSRVSLFGPDGRVLYERIVTPLDNSGRSRLVTIVGVVDQRKLHVLYDPPAEEKRGGMFTRYVLLTDASATQVLDTVAKTVVTEELINADGRAIFRLPFTPINNGPKVLLGADRKLLIEQPPARRSDQAEFVIKVEVQGRIVREARFVYRPLPTPRDSLRALVETRIAAFPSPSLAREAANRALDIPEYLPPISSAILDEAGRVWLRREAFQPRQDWLVLDDVLRPLATVRFPSGADFFRFSGGYCWAIERDALDDPSVVAYRFPMLPAGRVP